MLDYCRGIKDRKAKKQPGKIFLRAEAESIASKKLFRIVGNGPAIVACRAGKWKRKQKRLAL
jgi:hypothetical protein